MNYSALLPPNWKQTITSWLKEDIPSFDYGGYVVGNQQEKSILWCKSESVLAGVPFFEEVFNQVNCRVEWKITEGTYLPYDSNKPKIEVAQVFGSAKDLLQGERLALNILSRCSGIALQCYRLNLLKKENNYNGILAGTRKTTPGFRLVEKYGMLIGGVDTHRMDLSSMIMLKDNHLWSKGSITNAIQSARQVGGFSLKIDVEVQNEEEAIEAIKSGADIIMLDNYQPPEIHLVAERLKKTYSKDYSFLLEASGGINEKNVKGYFGQYIDIISMSSTSQSVQHVDYSLKVQHKE